VITAAVRKQCAACRYSKCLSIGMRPELVLDDEEKKTRFRKFLAKKQDEQEQNRQPISPVYDQDPPATPLKFPSPILSPKHPLPLPSPTSTKEPVVYGTRLSPLSNASSTPAPKVNNFLYETPEVKVKTEIDLSQNTSNYYQENTSTYGSYNYLFKRSSFTSYPNPYQSFDEKHHQSQTMSGYGENFRDWAQFPQYLKANQSPLSSFYRHHADPQRDQPTERSFEKISAATEVEFLRYSQSNTDFSEKSATSVITNYLKEESLDTTFTQSMENFDEYNQFMSCEVPSTSSKTYESMLNTNEERDSKPFDQFATADGEELIQKFVKAKTSPLVGTDTGPQKENLYTDSTSFVESSPRNTDQGKRKSVIVRAGTNKTSDSQLRNEKLDESNIIEIIDNTLELMPDAREMLKNLNFDMIQDIYTNEEENQVERLVRVWQDKWEEVNFGHHVINQYIRFCRQRREIPSQCFKEVNLKIRERCLNFVSSLEEAEQITSEEKVALFRQNLDSAEMMVYVHAFNLETWSDELEFALGKQDKIQWMDRDSSIKGLPLSTIVTHMPISEVEKLELYKNLMSCMMTVVKDRTVFVLMWLIIIFSQEEDTASPTVLKINKSFSTMLRRHLIQQQSKDVDSEMNIIYTCIGYLPTLKTSFEKIRNA